MLRDETAWALASVTAQTVRSHGRTLQRYQAHAEVVAAYAALRQSVHNDPALFDALVSDA